MVYPPPADNGQRDNSGHEGKDALHGGQIAAPHADAQPGACVRAMLDAIAHGPDTYRRSAGTLTGLPR